MSKKFKIVKKKSMEIQPELLHWEKELVYIWGH